MPPKQTAKKDIVKTEKLTQGDKKKLKQVTEGRVLVFDIETAMIKYGCGMWLQAVGLCMHVGGRISDTGWFEAQTCGRICREKHRHRRNASSTVLTLVFF